MAWIYIPRYYPCKYKNRTGEKGGKERRGGKGRDAREEEREEEGRKRGKKRGRRSGEEWWSVDIGVREREKGEGGGSVKKL